MVTDKTIGSDEALRKFINREQRKRLSSIISTIKSSDSHFYWEDENNTVFIYTSLEKLRFIGGRAFSWVCMDGTFKVAPKGYNQLYTIHIMFTNGEVIPLFHIGMKNRQADTYALVFKKIDSVFLDITKKHLFTKETSCMLDFEFAVVKALEKFKCSIHGCSFHFMNALYRKIVSLGLKTLYFKDPDIRILLKKFMMLC